jgi:capsular exopolysaccharide synthesis family protein
MRNPFTHYTLLAKRWAWVMLLGIFLCGGSTYIITKLMPPVYQASALLLVSFNTSNSAADNTTAALAVLPTYAQLIKNPAVLQPVLAHHQGLTLDQLSPMISVTPQSNTQVIELDVNNSDPRLAAQLANEVGQSLAHYSNTNLNATVEVLSAIVPTIPIQPKPSLDAMLGALVGLGLALALIVAFEWFDDRIGHPEEIQELLDVDILTTIPYLSAKQRLRNAEEIPALAEGCRILSATFNTIQHSKPFKLVMVTSALAGEGKSTIVANLGLFLAMSGKRVLLVDADLRHPVLDQHFQLDNHQGLYNVFLEMWGQIQVELTGQPTEIETLRVLPAGAVPSNPAELLQSHLVGQVFEQFKKSSFDYIIFDTPPLLPVADTLILASYMDATILVVDVSKTPRKILARARQILRRTAAPLLGVTVNKSCWPDYGDIRDYLNSMHRQQRPEGPHRSPNIPIANDTPTLPEQRAKDSKDMSTMLKKPANGSYANGMLNERISNGDATILRASPKPRVVPRRPQLTSAAGEQKQQVDPDITPKSPSTQSSNDSNEHNTPSSKPEDAKFRPLNTVGTDDIANDSSITGPMPQLQKRNQ